MNGINDYYVIIAASLIIIISYFFNVFSKKTGVPSVLLLILFGILIKYGGAALGFEDIDVHVTPYLGILGTVGLILIVLEAALDLRIRKSKKKLIIRSLVAALLGIAVNAVLLTLLIQFVVGGIEFSVGLIYAIPLSIMSSAIVIPSVSTLPEEKKEFMIYESTFADILGIMIFYAALDGVSATGTVEATFSIGGNLLLTLIVSVVASLLIFFIFNKLKGEVKLFLLISILMLFTTIGKVFHLSTLLLILIFGLLLRNQFLLPKFIRDRLDNNEFSEIFKNFNLITLESSFVLRTFFFVVFGTSIVLASIFEVQVWIISIIALIILYGSRFLLLRIFVGEDVVPELYLAPRGLISILLFFSIPDEYTLFDFETGTLLFMIIATSIIMATGLISYKKKMSAEKETAKLADEAQEENLIVDNEEAQ